MIAFCIATDATGVLVLPDPRPDKKRQPCRRAHFFVQIADADHVFFEYTPVETSAVVSELFRGFSGFVQADAKSVYDVLYRLPHERELSPPASQGTTSTGITGIQGTTISKEGHIGVSRG